MCTSARIRIDTDTWYIRDDADSNVIIKLKSALTTQKFMDLDLYIPINK